MTETADSGITDNYPNGTNFVSNGQRNGTAQVNLDGNTMSAPEQGESGNSTVAYSPSVETIQEFKLQNNSFSAEFGNNGGTVLNLVMKQGTNNFHGSGWWYGQRSAFDAKDYFNSVPKPDDLRDQYGFAIGGPVVKNTTLFCFDLEKSRTSNPVNIFGVVPTDLERSGDFSQSLLRGLGGIFDPRQCITPPGGTSCVRTQFSDGGVLNKISASEIDPIGKAIINLYPEPNVPAPSFPIGIPDTLDVLKLSSRQKGIVRWDSAVCKSISDCWPDIRKEIPR